MFQNFFIELLLLLVVEFLIVNFYKWSFFVKNFIMNEKLKKFFNVLIINIDGKIEFILIMEGYKYLVYGVQWYLEKVFYEWKNLDGIFYVFNVVKIVFYLVEFFVNEVWKNNYYFKFEFEEEKVLIYQFSLIYIGNIFLFQ